MDKVTVRNKELSAISSEYLSWANACLTACMLKPTFLMELPK